MKKVLFLFAMVLAFVINLHADTVAQCQVSGAQNGATATVSIESYDLDKDVVTIGFYNDSDTPATVTAEVSNIKGGYIKVTAYVAGQSSTTKDAKWISDNIPASVTISSAKCQK